MRPNSIPIELNKLPRNEEKDSKRVWFAKGSRNFFKFHVHVDFFPNKGRIQILFLAKEVGKLNFHWKREENTCCSLQIFNPIFNFRNFLFYFIYFPFYLGSLFKIWRLIPKNNVWKVLRLNLLFEYQQKTTVLFNSRCLTFII